MTAYWLWVFALCCQSKLLEFHPLLEWASLIRCPYCRAFKEIFIQ